MTFSWDFCDIFTQIREFLAELFLLSLFKGGAWNTPPLRRFGNKSGGALYRFFSVWAWPLGANLIGVPVKGYSSRMRFSK